MLALRNIILEMIAKGAGLKETIDHLCQKIEEMAPDIVCSMLIVDRDGIIHPLSAPSLPESYSAAYEGLMIGPNLGSCGSAAYLRKPVIVTNIATDSRWIEYKDAALSLGLQACWSTPLFDKSERVIGTFAFYYRQPRGPTKAERKTVAACIHLCTIALERHERVLDRERRANVDALTEIANLSSFDLALSHLTCDEPGTWALFILDLDNLKVVNDNFGHHAGDLLLRATAARISTVAQPNRVFRIGGDEFAILVQSPKALRDLNGFASILLDSLCESIDFKGHAIFPKATIGGAVLSDGDYNVDTVRQNADYALYHAKETGRGGFVRYWLGLDTRIMHRMASIRDVDAALREGRVEAHYQPIVRLDTQQIVALEALCRLRMANGGLLTAASFTEAMADVHIASELTKRMLQIVSTDLRIWLDMAIPLRHIGINMALADFHEAQLDEQITSALAEQGLSLEYLVIEITEGAYPALRDKIGFQAIEVLRSKGLRIVMDDFGNAGGLLMPLLTMQVDMIKIDKVLVDRLMTDSTGAAVIGGLLYTAKRLGIDVIAEGVENQEQSIKLADLGCVLAQGHYFSKPLDSNAITRLLSKNSEKGSLTTKKKPRSART